MGTRILVVEDHHDTSFTLCKLLKSEGYEVDHAIDGMSGLTHASSNHPDLIVTDLQMPRMGGIEMIKRIKSEEEFQGVAIIVMSAYGKRLIDEALSAGADAFVEKPVDFEKFLSKVRSIVPPEKPSIH